MVDRTEDGKRARPCFSPAGMRKGGGSGGSKIHRKEDLKKSKKRLCLKTQNESVREKRTRKRRKCDVCLYNRLVVVLCVAEKPKKEGEKRCLVGSDRLVIQCCFRRA